MSFVQGAPADNRRMRKVAFERLQKLGRVRRGRLLMRLADAIAVTSPVAELPPAKVTIRSA